MKHYELSGDYGVWCGDPKAHGKEVTDNLYNVTCLACLAAVQQAGELAKQRERALLRDIAVFEIKWSAWCLMWCAIAANYQNDYLHDTGSIQ